MTASGLSVLVIDDERPAREDLAYLAEQDPRVGQVLTAGSAAEALRVLHEQPVDLVLSDIHMPGLNGLDLAQTLRRFKQPPEVVFVTAFDEHAIEAFEIGVVDYLLKPVRASRLAEALRRVCERAAPPEDGDETIAVEVGGVTRFVARSEIRYVEAHGDYSRLHTPGARPLLRTPLTRLEEEWADAGFVRIHRSTIVALAHVDEVRTQGGRMTLLVDGEELTVSRRHTREVRDLLVRAARPGAERPPG